MTSILEAIRHYQRLIERSKENNDANLLYCLEKLNKLPIVVQYLQETKVGRTVNNLRKNNGAVGHAATALVAKWKEKVETDLVKSSSEHERLPTYDNENKEPSTRSEFTDRPESENVTSNSDSVSHPSDNNSSESNCSEKPQEKSNRLESRRSSNGKWYKPHHNRSSISKSNDERGTISSHPKEKRKRIECKEMSAKKPKRVADLIDIDSTMGTSFAEALGMLGMPSTSKARKRSIDQSSSSNISPSSELKKSGKLSSFDETPILLTKRPRLEPPLDIAVELQSPCTITNSETMAVDSVLQPSRKQMTQMTDEEMISYNVMSRTTKTKVFSGNKSEFKFKVATLFEMCIHILQDNIDLLEFTGGVPFDILRPVLERTTCQQLMILEDYNPYLMEDTHCLWEQHCKRRFRSRSREELETWRDMYFRCLDEEKTKFNILTSSIKLSKERQTKPAYVDTNAPRNMKTNQLKSSASAHRVAAWSHSEGNVATVGSSKLQNETKSKDSTQNRKRSKKSNDDPDWTPTTWYKTLYKKPVEPKPPPIKKTIDMLRYDRAKALEQRKEEWKRRPR